MDAIPTWVHINHYHTEGRSTEIISTHLLAGRRRGGAKRVELEFGIKVRRDLRPHPLRCKWRFIRSVNRHRTVYWLRSEVLFFLKVLFIQPISLSKIALYCFWQNFRLYQIHWKLSVLRHLLVSVSAKVAKKVKSPKLMYLWAISSTKSHTLRLFYTIYFW